MKLKQKLCKLLCITYYSFSLTTNVIPRMTNEEPIIISMVISSLNTNLPHRKPQIIKMDRLVYAVDKESFFNIFCQKKA